MPFCRNLSLAGSISKAAPFTSTFCPSHPLFFRRPRSPARSRVGHEKENRSECKSLSSDASVSGGNNLPPLSSVAQGKEIALDVRGDRRGAASTSELTSTTPSTRGSVKVWCNCSPPNPASRPRWSDREDSSQSPQSPHEDSYPSSAPYWGVTIGGHCQGAGVQACDDNLRSYCASPAAPAGTTVVNRSTAGRDRSKCRWHQRQPL